MIAYFSVASTRAFWEDHWGRHSLDELLRAAHRSPLAALIEATLPPYGRLLEAGCGLGQYVLLLRERGHRAVGVDRVFEALRECRKHSPTAPLAVMNLRRLGVRSNSFSAYISLGVVEHDPDGPDVILREAHRVLEPGGILILSVPYINGVRRLGAWWIRRRNRRVREAGGEFYQFAFSWLEARGFIERNGFRVLNATPYDPARVLRGLWRSMTRVFRTGGGLAQSAAQRTGGVSSGSVSPEPMAAQYGIRNAVRRLLYTRAGLHTFGHMILFTAVKR